MCFTTWQSAMIFITTVCLYCFICIPVAAKNALYGFDVVMLSDPKAPRMIHVDNEANIFVDLSSKAFTWCVYSFLVRKKGKTYHTLAGYASREHREFHEIQLEANVIDNKTKFSVRKKAVTFRGAPALDKWTLLCVTWSGETGKASLYLDAIKAGDATMQQGVTIGKDGVLVVGQDQDDYDGDYQPEDGVYGRMTQFNAWDRVLTQKEIKKVKDGKMFGNLVDWRKDYWALDDNAYLLPTEAPNAIIAKTSCIDNGVSTDLTICLRFNGKSPFREKYTLFSYMNSHGSKELELIVNGTRSVNIVVGIESKLVTHLTAYAGWQHWCFVWSEETLRVYFDGGLYDIIDYFMEGTQMSMNGDFFIHESNSRKRVQAKVINAQVWERALTGKDVAYEYVTVVQKNTPPKLYFSSADDINSDDIPGYAGRIWRPPYIEMPEPGAPCRPLCAQTNASDTGLPISYDCECYV